MTLWFVLEDNGGAHDPSAVVSVWVTRAGAEQEAARVPRSRVVQIESGVPGEVKSGRWQTYWQTCLNW